MRSLTSISLVLMLVTACGIQLNKSMDKTIAYEQSSEVTRCQEGYTAACKKVSALGLGGGL